MNVTIATTMTFGIYYFTIIVPVLTDEFRNDIYIPGWEKTYFYTLFINWLSESPGKTTM